jgi:hypothetical protein
MEDQKNPKPIPLKTSQQPQNRTSKS